LKRTCGFLAVTGLLLAAVALFAACGDDDGHNGGDMMGSGGMGSGGMMDSAAPAGSIKIDLLNWAVVPAQSSVKAGSVTFWAVHDMGHQHMNSEGGVTHDLQVMKKKGDGSFEMAGQVQGLTMGEAKALTLNLTPGDYELSCNVVEEIGGKTISHYVKGMRAPFTVTA
jgi:uncharacterized cupredoxin-like copper-binding protein